MSLGTDRCCCDEDHRLRSWPHRHLVEDQRLSGRQISLAAPLPILIRSSTSTLSPRIHVNFSIAGNELSRHLEVALSRQY